MGIRTEVPCPEKAEAFDGLRRMDAPKGTQAGWMEQTGSLRLEAESPYLRVFARRNRANIQGLFEK